METTRWRRRASDEGVDNSCRITRSGYQARWSVQRRESGLTESVRDSSALPADCPSRPTRLLPLEVRRPVLEHGTLLRRILDLATLARRPVSATAAKLKPAERRESVRSSSAEERAGPHLRRFGHTPSSNALRRPSMNGARSSLFGTDKARCRSGKVRRTSTRPALYRLPNSSRCSRFGQC